MTTVTRLIDPAGRMRRRSTDRSAPVSAPRALSSSGERVLLRSAAQGDTHAWDALVDAYLPQLWRSTAEAGLDADAAAQVCEVVWLRLVQSLALLEDESVGSWLQRVAVEECARHVRYAERRRARERPALTVLPTDSD